MLAGPLDFINENSIYIGIDWPTVTLQFLDSSDNPVPMTGWQVFAWCKKIPGSPLIFDFGAVIADEANAIVTMALNKTQTKALSAGDFTWDLIFQKADGVRVGPVLAGKVKIIRLDTEPPL